MNESYPEEIFKQIHEQLGDYDNSDKYYALFKQNLSAFPEANDADEAHLFLDFIAWQTGDPDGVEVEEVEPFIHQGQTAWPSQFDPQYKVMIKAASENVGYYSETSLKGLMELFGTLSEKGFPLEGVLGTLQHLVSGAIAELHPPDGSIITIAPEEKFGVWRDFLSSRGIELVDPDEEG